MSEPPQKRPRHEALELPTHSTEFPEGYGDFVFKSSDGVIFHFPRFLLAHVSPVFKEMFAVGDGAQKQEMTTLYEDYATLEYFLCHIDPAKETPQLDWDRMEGTLQAAEKYQVNNVLKWFEKEATQSLTAPNYPLLSDPTLCFALARRYDLHMITRLSLRQLIKCQLSKIMESPYIDGLLLKRILCLRAERTQVLVDLIRDCPEVPYKRNPECTYCNQLKYLESHIGWKWSAMRAIVTEPSWSGILSGIKKYCHCVPLKNEKTREKARKLEEEIPELSVLDL
ncbi:hypothetical protein CPB86DRAFT_789749 [Serendipita vermifera]|nr:hypothetical protein CPB86DRAFT_789749 [Serendipita vermifera]